MFNPRLVKITQERLPDVYKQIQAMSPYDAVLCLCRHVGIQAPERFEPIEPFATHLANYIVVNYPH